MLEWRLNQEWRRIGADTVVFSLGEKNNESNLSCFPVVSFSTASIQVIVFFSSPRNWNMEHHLGM